MIIMIFVIMFMIVEIKTDTMIVCPPTCYGATVGCAVFYLISNDPRFLTFVQRASIQNKRLALNVSYKVTKLYYLTQIRSLFPIGS